MTHVRSQTWSVVRHSFVILLIALTGGCRKEKPQSTASPNVANKVAERAVTLFYESPDLVLAPENRTIALPENDAAALSPILRELLKGSSNAAVPKLFPADAVLRGAYLLPDGTAVVDLGGPTLAEGWNTGSHNEMMAIYSVVQTLATNSPKVRQVRIVVNGATAETLGGHISIDRPLRPRRDLLTR